MKIKYTKEEKQQQKQAIVQKRQMEENEELKKTYSKSLGKSYDYEQYKNIAELQPEVVKSTKKWNKFITVKSNLTRDFVIDQYIKALKKQNDTDKNYLKSVIENRNKHEIVFGYYPLICQEITLKGTKKETRVDRYTDDDGYVEVDKYEVDVPFESTKVVFNNFNFRNHFNKTYKSSQIIFDAPTLDSLIFIDELVLSGERYVDGSGHSIATYTRGDYWNRDKLWGDVSVSTTVMFIPTFELKVLYNNGNENVTVYYTENECGRVIDLKKLTKGKKKLGIGWIIALILGGAYFLMGVLSMLGVI